MTDNTHNKASKDCHFYDTISKLRAHMEEEVRQAQIFEEPVSTACYNHDLMAYFSTILQQSATASALYQNIKNQGWDVVLCDLGEVDFTIDYAEQILELNHQGLSEEVLADTSYFRNAVLFALIRALRDIDQENRIHAIAADYNAEHTLMLERFRCADMDSVAVMIAWELRTDGFNDLWRYLLGSDYRDMALAFARYAEKQQEIQAMHAAFDTWFDNDQRVADCEREALNFMDSLLKDEEAYHQLGDQILAADQIEFLSSLPHKAPYLQKKGQEVLSAEHYAGLKDEINKAHLFHIVYDMNVTYRGGVAFNDSSLAQKIFPEESETLH